jgi:hypothetical protein
VISNQNVRCEPLSLIGGVGGQSALTEGAFSWRFAYKVANITHLGDAPGNEACYGSSVMKHGGAEEPRPIERTLAMATAAPVQPAAPHRGIRALLARHPLVSFFVLAFAGTWLTELPYVLSEDGSGLLPFSSPLLIWTSPLTIFMGPFLAAFVMTGAIEGREGVGRFLRRFVLWRVGFR